MIRKTCIWILVFALSVVLVLNACTPVRTEQSQVSDGVPIEYGAAIAPGDRIEVIRYDGVKTEFEVLHLNEAGIVGSLDGIEVFFAYEEIYNVKIRPGRPRKNLFAVEGR